MKYYPHFSTYYLGSANSGYFVVYSNGLAENPSNSLWIITWPKGYWD